jgi:hypothetical protein
MTEDFLLHSLCEFMYDVANVFTGTVAPRADELYAAINI